MSAQAELTAAHLIQLGTSNAAPVPGNDPHYTMSPVAPSGLKTTGLLLGLSAPSAGPATGPFTLVVWIRDPLTKQWFSGSSFAIDFNQGFVTFDFDASDLFFQFTAAVANGFVYIHLMEQ